MSDLKKLILTYVQNNFNFKKLSNFKLNFLQNSKFDAFTPIVFDRKTKINCVLNLKNPDNIIQPHQIFKLSKIEITDSNFDILFYKNSKTNSINCLIILIINECNFIEADKKYDSNFYENLQNLNFLEDVETPLKNYIFSYLKANYKSEFEFPHWAITADVLSNKTLKYSNYGVENVLLGYESYEHGKFRFLNSKENKLFNHTLEKFSGKVEELKSCVEILPSKLQDESLVNIFKEAENNKNAYQKIFYNTLILDNKKKIITRNDILDR